MSLQNSTTEIPVAIMERLQEDHVALTEAIRLMDTIGGIAYQGMIATGNEDSQEESVELIDIPWEAEHLQKNTFKIILKLAGDAWRLLNDCVDPKYLFSETGPAPEPQAAAEGGA